MPPGRGQRNRPPIAENGNYGSQNLGLAERAIVIRKRVAASDQTIVMPADQSMRDECLVPVTQHNLTGEQFLGALPANRDHVSRPHRRQHAGSGDLQPGFAELSNDVRRQVTFHGVLNLACRIHWLGILPVAMATRLRGGYLAAAQRTRFKQAFLPECGFQVGLLDDSLPL